MMMFDVNSMVATTTTTTTTMAKPATAVADDKVLLRAVVSAVGVNGDIHDNNKNKEQQ